MKIRSFKVRGRTYAEGDIKISAIRRLCFLSLCPLPSSEALLLSQAAEIERCRLEAQVKEDDEAALESKFCRFSYQYTFVLLTILMMFFHDVDRGVEAVGCGNASTLRLIWTARPPSSSLRQPGLFCCHGTREFMG